MKKRILLLLAVSVIMSIGALWASSDIFFQNTDTKVGIVYGSDFEHFAMQFGAVSHFRGTDNRLGMDLVWWFVDGKGYAVSRVRELNLNYNRIIAKTDWFILYPIASVGYHLNYWEWSIGQGNNKVSYKIDDSGFAAAIGAGVEFTMPKVEEYQFKFLKLYIEPRYFFVGNKQLQVVVGLSINYPG